MDIYVISPLSNLEAMKKGDRTFVLAHLWMKSEKYRAFIMERKAEGQFLTLDNSAAERSLVTEDALIKICHELMPNEVIAPDVLFDADATMANLDSFVERMTEEGLLHNINIFFCPQGKSQEEWLSCYEYGLDNDFVNVIGFSKIAVPNAWLGIDGDQGIKEGRHNAYNYLLANDMLKKPIHCLGQGDVSEFMYYKHPMMRSTDSVYPVMAAMNGIDFESNEFERIPTPHDYLETEVAPNKDQEALINKNVRVLRWCAFQGESDRL